MPFSAHFFCSCWAFWHKLPLSSYFLQQCLGTLLWQLMIRWIYSTWLTVAASPFTQGERWLFPLSRVMLGFWYLHCLVPTVVTSSASLGCWTPRHWPPVLVGLVLGILQGNQQLSINWCLLNDFFHHYSVNSVLETIWIKRESQYHADLFFDTGHIHGHHLARLFSLKVLCGFPLLLQNASAGQHFSIMVYTLCRVCGLFASREAFHCLQWGPPSIPTPSHPVGGYLGRPGHFVVLGMSTMQQGQGLSPPTTHGSEVPLLIFRPCAELSSHAELELQPQGLPCGQPGGAAGQRAGTLLHFGEAW